MRALLAAAALGTIIFSVHADGASTRDRKVRAAFQRAHPCPDPAIQIRAGTAGGTRGACPGFEVDHIVALCAGGADAVENLQWLTAELHRLKTRDDVRLCRLRKRAPKSGGPPSAPGQ